MIESREFSFVHDGHDIVLGLDEAGTGEPVVLLPALSSISTRGEMRPLLQRLSPHFRVVAVDWPGFGTQPRPPLHWTPDILSAFLQHVLKTVVAAPAPRIVAAGHAAAYVLDHAAHHPGALGRVVLVAPTWRGPLPTMAGGERPLFVKIRGAVEAPVIGPLLYRLNINAFVVRRMVAGHVYSDPAFLEPRLAQKREVVTAPGGRFGSAAFVTGGLDRLASREDFLALAARAGVPLFVVYGAETPPRSRAEMEALAALPGVGSARLPRGKLAVHEEFPDEVYAAIRSFLAP